MPVSSFPPGRQNDSRRQSGGWGVRGRLGCRAAKGGTGEGEREIRGAARLLAAAFTLLQAACAAGGERELQGSTVIHSAGLVAA